MADTFDILAKVVSETQCKPGWDFSLIESEGHLRLVIQIACMDNYNPSKPFTVNHLHAVPPTTFNEASWRRWIFEQCMRSMTHEIGESLRFGPNEERPFEPYHGPGEDPYTVHEYRPNDPRLITQDGSLKPTTPRTPLISSDC